MKLKETANTQKKANTGSTKPPLPNRYTATLEEKNEDQQHKASPDSMPKPPPIYIMPWSESASELYRPSDRRLTAK
jgi:hypothetical protein